MIEVIFRYGNSTAFKNRLNALALSFRDGDDENGDPYRTEAFLGSVSTPHLEDVNGDKYFTARLVADDADKIPDNDQNPAFAIIWRSDEVDEDGNLEPWPEAEGQSYDIDGNPDGTRFQGVGRIA